MGSGEEAKLAESLYKERISRLWSDAEVIKINRGDGGVIDTGEWAKLTKSL